MTATLGAEPDDGTVTLLPDWSFVYIPQTNFSGTDSFTYYASDGVENSEPAQVTISVFAHGDVDRNGKVDIRDIFKIKLSDKGFGTGATDATWEDGDFVGNGLGTPPNGIVNIHDIFAIKAAGRFGAGPYMDQPVVGSLSLSGLSLNTASEAILPEIQPLNLDWVAELPTAEPQREETTPRETAIDRLLASYWR